MHCWNCQRRIKGHHAFCRHCGKPYRHPQLTKADFLADRWPKAGGQLHTALARIGDEARVLDKLSAEMGMPKPPKLKPEVIKKGDVSGSTRLCTKCGGSGCRHLNPDISDGRTIEICKKCRGSGWESDKPTCPKCGDTGRYIVPGDNRFYVGGGIAGCRVCDCPAGKPKKVVDGRYEKTVSAGIHASVDPKLKVCSECAGSGVRLLHPANGPGGPVECECGKFDEVNDIHLDLARTWFPVHRVNGLGDCEIKPEILESRGPDFDPIIHSGDVLLVSRNLAVFANVGKGVHRIIDLIDGNRWTDAEFALGLTLSELRKSYEKQSAHSWADKIQFVCDKGDMRYFFETAIEEKPMTPVENHFLATPTPKNLTPQPLFVINKHDRVIYNPDFECETHDPDVSIEKGDLLLVTRHGGLSPNPSS